MKAIKRFFGIVLLTWAVTFVFRIPMNLQTGGDKMTVHIEADIISAAFLGFGGFALLKDKSINFRRISGVVVLSLAFLFVFRIPVNLHTGGDKMIAHIVGDIIFAAFLGFGGFALLKDQSSRDLQDTKANQSSPLPTRPPDEAK